MEQGVLRKAVAKGNKCLVCPAFFGGEVQWRGSGARFGDEVGGDSEVYSYPV